MSAQQPSAVPASVTASVLQSSQPVPDGSHVVSGVDFDQFQGRDITVAEMVDNLAHTGFQGSAVAQAASIINEMVAPPEHGDIDQFKSEHLLTVYPV